MGARAGRSARRAAERALAAAERAQAPVPAPADAFAEAPADAFAEAPADAPVDAGIEELVVPSPVVDAATGVAAAPASDAPADALAAEVSLLSQTLQVLLPALPLHTSKPLVTMIIQTALTQLYPHNAQNRKMHSCAEEMVAYFKDEKLFTALGFQPMTHETLMDWLKEIPAERKGRREQTR
ncbi:hypothetical protein T492DRAFT_862894, partial [Pavlovales sp. CCMP2436]